jgi:DNA-binding response OmpR family regulator
MPSIFMIEDNQEILNLYRIAFEHEEFEFSTAQNGMDGIKTALEKHPDLILLDLLLPEMDGISVMKILRENDWGKTVPIIILTNMDNNDDILNAVEENDPTFYLTKANNEPSTVIAKVKEILTRKTAVNSSLV